MKKLRLPFGDILVVAWCNHVRAILPVECSSSVPKDDARPIFFDAHNFAICTLTTSHGLIFNEVIKKNFHDGDDRAEIWMLL